MIYSQVIIVGGGPAGSTCAWMLRRHGIDCIILDKQPFPRTKLCAGWITPQVISDLQMDVERYPHSLTKFDRFHVHLYGRCLKIRVHQYAIRRYEFDHWLLQRSGVPVYTHHVKSIKKDGADYVIDDLYRCRYLVGTGGTSCPVYRTFFKSIQPRHPDSMVVALEQEFPYHAADPHCHLWFLQNKLPGYSWYVPKGNGFVNVGVGGILQTLKANGDSIHTHWKFLVQQLERMSLVKDYAFQPKGYVYPIRNGIDRPQLDHILLGGDAAGLATQDMGEGIGPAVQSGILIADSILTGRPYSLDSVKKYSFPKLQPLLKLAKWIAGK